MRGGWFKCPTAAWEQVREVIPKPWPYACMVADVRWWNDQLKIEKLSTPPSYEQLAMDWGVSVGMVQQICDEASIPDRRRPSPSRASRGLSDQTTDPTTHSESVSGKSGSAARESAAGSNQAEPESASVSAEEMDAIYARIGLSSPLKD